MASYESSDPTERLAAVRASINRALQAQSYTVRGRTHQSALLKQLQALEQDLMQQVEDAEGGGSMSSLAINTDPT